MSLPDPKVVLMRLVPATMLLVATAALAQLGVNYSATATTVCRLIAAKPGTSQKIGQLFSCPSDAPKSALVATTTPAAAAAAQPAAPAQAAPARMPLGINLAGTSYYSTEAPFLDRSKTAGEWALDGDGKGWRAYPGKVDAAGFPTEVPPGAEFGAAMGVEDPALSPPDRWVLTWQGTAQLSRLLSGAIVSTAPGRAVFDAQAAVAIPLWRGGTVTQVHLVRLDQEALLAKGELFNPAFLEKADDWSLIRFMDWGATNGSAVVTWADRPQLGAVRWGMVPIEVQVALANQAKADGWFTIPAKADDDYVRRTLSYIRDNLAPGLRAHVEYSNEMWNWGFPQTRWAQERANALWSGEPGAGFWQQDGVRNLIGGNSIWYGFRSAQIAAIGKDVFAGQRARLVNVVATQTVYKGLEDSIWNGVARAKLGAPGMLFDEYAVTTYFGNQLSSSDAGDKAKILAWARGGAAGLDAAFREIEVGGVLVDNQSLATMPAIYAYQNGVADKLGLKLVAYEGGLHAVALNHAGQDQADVVAMLKRMQADPRMPALLTRMAADFAAAGGTELTYFNDVGGWNQFGTWGLMDNLYQASPAYEALRAIAR